MTNTDVAVRCRCGKVHSDCTCARDCEETRGKIEDLLRDELCAEESKPIREHIAQCPDCSAEQRVCEALTDAVQRGCRERAPEQLKQEILAQLKLL